MFGLKIEILSSYFAFCQRNVSDLFCERCCRQKLNNSSLNNLVIGYLWSNNKKNLSSKTEINQLSFQRNVKLCLQKDILFCLNDQK